MVSSEKSVDSFVGIPLHVRAFQVALVVKNPSANAGDMRDMGLVTGSRRFTGGGHGNPLQYIA